MSLTNLRPFLVKKHHYVLKDGKCEELYDHFFSDVKAKQSDALLCIAKVCEIVPGHRQERKPINIDRKQ